MFEQWVYAPASPFRQLFRRIPYKWQLKLILLGWELLYRWRRRTWQWAGSYLSGSPPNLGVGQIGLVSVVLPVYNQAQTLAASIESVLNQNYSRLELIIINDGSTDETPRILEQYAAHNRVVIINQSNQHLSAALNRGFQEARGEFFTWTSGDNLMHPEQVERLVKYLVAHPDVALIYADFELIDDSSHFIEDAEAVFMRGEAGTPVVRPKHEPERLNIGFECVVGPCFMYRSFLPRLIGHYDSKLEGAEDFDYWIRVNNFFKVRHLGDNQPLYRYRVHGQRMSTALKPRISQLRRWLMKREQKFQRSLSQPVIVAADEVSLHHLSNLQPSVGALPPLTFIPFRPEQLESNALIAASIFHFSSINTRLIAQIKRANYPLICWFTSKDLIPSAFDQLAMDIDLILAPANEVLNTHNVLFVSHPTDMYDLLRIFIAARILSSEHPGL